MPAQMPTRDNSEMEGAGGMPMAPAKESKKPEPVEFETPTGFKAPEPSDSGKEGEFDLVCTFKAYDEGKCLRLVKLGDMELPDEASKEKKGGREKAPDYSEMSQSIVSPFQSQQ